MKYDVLKKRIFYVIENWQNKVNVLQDLPFLPYIPYIFFLKKISQ